MATRNVFIKEFPADGLAIVVPLHQILHNSAEVHEHLAEQNKPFPSAC